MPQSLRATTLVILLGLAGSSARAARGYERSVEHGPSEHVLHIESQALAEQRTVRVALPNGYGDARVSYPLLVVLDAYPLFDFAPTIARYLARSGAAPPMVVAAIDNTHRQRDMTPPGMRIAGVPEPGGEAFLDFIENDLIPILESEFRVTDLRVLVGHSHGGSIGAYALATRPGLFDAALAMDTPSHLDGFFLVDRLVERPDAPLRFIVGETRFDWPDDAWTRIERSAGQGSILAKFSIDDETHQWMVFPGIYQGLKLLFSEYGALDAGRATLGAIEDQFAHFSHRCGGGIPVPVAVYQQAIESCLLESRADDAQALLARLIAGYGATVRTRGLKERIAEARRLGPLEETVDSMVHGERLSPRDAAPFLGEWTGTMTTGSGAPADVRFNLRVEAGRVEGTMTQFAPNGRELESELVVIRWNDGKLGLGVTNGTNPRGVLLHSLVPDEPADPQLLSGVMQMRGIRFRPPGGRDLPVTRTELRRAPNR